MISDKEQMPIEMPAVHQDDISFSQENSDHLTPEFPSIYFLKFN